MVCASGLRELASHNAFLQDYIDQGYHVDFVGGYLVFYGLPYLDQGGCLQHGDWASPLDLNGDVIDAPSDHQAWWRGSRPHDERGRALGLGGGPAAVTISDDLITNFSFSFKLQDERGQMRVYRSFAEKLETYLPAITAPALAVHPEATPLRAIVEGAAKQGSPLRFPDTMSARYQINDLSALLRGKKVAIIGLGGTGSYILDLLARTHLEEIALFDDDKVHVHTIFRFPGFIPGAIGKLKVHALADHYDAWHGGIARYPERITADNIERLGDYDFIFVSVDDGPARRLIVEWASGRKIPFVDCGMGLNRSRVGLSGLVRVTGVDRRAFDNNVGTVRLPIENAKADEYRKQGQITELNALNATLAVLRFKQHFGLFDRECGDTASIFDTADWRIGPCDGST